MNKNNTTTTITIDGKQFTLDIDKAVEDGYLKPVRKEITSDYLSVGNVFVRSVCRSIRVILVRTQYRSGWSLVGHNGLSVFSDSHFNTGKHLDDDEILKILNNSEYEYVGNINEGVKQMVENLVKGKITD